MTGKMLQRVRRLEVNTRMSESGCRDVAMPYLHCMNSAARSTRTSASIWNVESLGTAGRCVRRIRCGLILMQVSGREVKPRKKVGVRGCATVPFHRVNFYHTRALVYCARKRNNFTCPRSLTNQSCRHFP